MSERADGGAQAEDPRPWTLERLEAFAALRTPVWVYDFERERFHWGNEPMLALFAAPSLEALRARYRREPMSEGMQRRLHAFRDRFARGERVVEPWTFYPEGQPPVHTDTSFSAVRIATELGTREAMLVEARLRPSSALSPEEQRLVVATQHANECVSLFSEGGETLVSNPAAERLRDAEGPSLDALFVDPKDAARLRAETLDPARVFRTEAALRTRAGPRWHALEARRIRDPVTGQAALLVMHHDVSDRRASETRLREARREAEALHESAAAASEAKSRFVAVMSHELRTPMTALLASAELLESSHLDAAQRETLSTIVEAGGQMVELIGDVLDVSAIEAGRIELAPQPTNLRPFLRRTLGPLKAAAEGKGLALELSVQADVPPAVLLDARRVGQVLLNLVGNAIKFTERGRVQVEVEWTGGGLTLAVRDEGPGFEPSHAARLFEPFERGDVSAQRCFEGVGLGLFIARSLVDLMEGRIRAETRPGEGATFFVDLPAAPVPMPSEPPARAKRPRLGLRLLLADDNRLSRRAVARLLRGLACEVVEASDGQEALERARASPFDAVILDVEMPRMDGPSAAEALRAEGDDVAPLVALTADAFFGASDAAGVFDAVEYKPVDLDRLATVLQRLASERRGVAPC
ncbi:MAG: ATP-binding protein [Myxococcota bacterium]